MIGGAEDAASMVQRLILIHLQTGEITRLILIVSNVAYLKEKCVISRLESMMTTLLIFVPVFKLVT